MRVDTALLFVRSPQMFLGRRSYVLVLSHMRSYSSLLCHILGSHAEISGYSEMHISYRGRLDLLRMRARVARSLDGDLSGRYVLDKVLHNDYAIAPSVIRRPNVFPIFLLRRPLPSVASIIEMGHDIAGVPWYSNAAAAADYYVIRAKRIAQLAQQQRSRRYLFVQAEQIVDQPERTLERIAGFLGLHQPLTESYSIFPQTGQVGSGDSSLRIMAGRIVRGPTHEVAPAALSESQTNVLTQTYEATRRILENGSSP